MQLAKTRSDLTSSAKSTFVHPPSSKTFPGQLPPLEPPSNASIYLNHLPSVCTVPLQLHYTLCTPPLSQFPHMSRDPFQPTTLEKKDWLGNKHENVRFSLALHFVHYCVKEPVLKKGLLCLSSHRDPDIILNPQPTDHLVSHFSLKVGRLEGWKVSQFPEMTRDPFQYFPPLSLGPNIQCRGMHATHLQIH